MSLFVKLFVNAIGVPQEQRDSHTETHFTRVLFSLSQPRLHVYETAIFKLSPGPV